MTPALPHLLRRIACAGLCALLLAAPGARADDDGDDGGPSGGDSAPADGGVGGGEAASFGRGSQQGSGNFVADLRSFGGAIGAMLRGGAAAPPAELVAAGIDAPARARLQAAGFRLIAERQGTLVPGTTARLAPPAGLDTSVALARARALAPAARFARNDLYRTQAVPCEGPRCSHLWQVGWVRQAPCRAPARIGMIDTAVARDHPALAGARIRAETIRGPGRGASGSQHGTAVAALLVGAPNGPLPGMLPQAELFAIDAFHRREGGDTADAFDLAGALDRLMLRRVAVINLSFAGPDNPVLEASTRAAASRGVVLTAAAGNAGPKAQLAYPAAYDWVVAVTAVDQSAQPYVRAAQGPHLDFAAPGVGLPAPGGGRALSGTSFAVPFVTAGVCRRRHPPPGAGRAGSWRPRARCGVWPRAASGPGGLRGLKLAAARPPDL
jgi:hypothetical protein